MPKPKSMDPCIGCTNNFYNHRPDGCWFLPKAKLVRRFKIDWWVSPLAPAAFVEVKTYDCHAAPGKYALETQPHPEAVDVVRLPRRTRAST